MKVMHTVNQFIWCVYLVEVLQSAITENNSYFFM